MPKAQRWTLLTLALLAALAAACEDRLPAFATPPPYDGGTAGSAPDDDAG